MVAMTTVSPEITERLAVERRQREARMRSWMMLADAFARIHPSDIQIEPQNVDAGPGAAGNLEQVKISFPEALPPHSELMLRMLQWLPGLLDNIQRDMMSDAERIAIGWPDLPRNR